MDADLAAPASDTKAEPGDAPPPPERPGWPGLLLLGIQCLASWAAASLTILVVFAVLRFEAPASVPAAAVWAWLLIPPSAATAAAGARSQARTLIASIVGRLEASLARPLTTRLAGAGLFLGLVLYTATTVLGSSGGWVWRAGFALTYLSFAPLIVSAAGRPAARSQVDLSAQAWHWFGLVVLWFFMYTVAAVALPLVINQTLDWRLFAVGVAALVPLAESMRRSRHLLRLGATTLSYLEGTVSLRVSSLSVTMIIIAAMLVRGNGAPNPELDRVLGGFAVTLMLVYPFTYTFGKGTSEYFAARRQALSTQGPLSDEPPPG